MLHEFRLYGCSCGLQVRIPMYGCDCYAYGLLSAGHCDLVVEGDLKPYDYMALVPVIEGAGGCITDWKVDHSQPMLMSEENTVLTIYGRGPVSQGQPLRLNINFKTGEADPYAGEVIAAGDSAVWKQALESLAWH